MTDLPFELKKLPPSALDVLRYFIEEENELADDIDIMDGADLSERSFSKAIKRLVTRGYASMTPDRLYQLTDKGVALAGQLQEFDGDSPAPARAVAPPPAPEPEPVTVVRRMVVVVPTPLVKDEETQVYLGLDAGEEVDEQLVVRVNVVNGMPDNPIEVTLSANGGPHHTRFAVTAGNFDKVRLRMQAFQMGPNPDDIEVAGGMYVDIDVTGKANEGGELTAYGTNVSITG